MSEPNEIMEHNEGREIDFEDDNKTDQIRLPHVERSVSRFEFGEALKRRVEEMKIGAMGKMEMVQEWSDKNDLQMQPCSLDSIEETRHKTLHSRESQRLDETQNNLLNSAKDNFCNVSRRVPDYLANCGDIKDVWTAMTFKEEMALSQRNPGIFDDFKDVTPRMRAITLDYLMKVASRYCLNRTTYYLSVDYFDRFLSTRPDISHSAWEVVGITCLFIAAKVEEITQPNISDYSDVSACELKAIVSCEFMILNSLDWEVLPTTPTDWLSLYTQLHSKSQDFDRRTLNFDFNKDFLTPTYSAAQFTRASQLMDLMVLVPEFLKFSYSAIAAAAMYYTYGKKIALSVSGFSGEQLRPCVEFMEVFQNIIKSSPDHTPGSHPVVFNGMSELPKNESYLIQTYSSNEMYFKKAIIYVISHSERHQNDVSLKTVGEHWPGLVDGDDETTDDIW